MLKLNNLTSSGKSRKRVGRGGARGATSGRGFGGQKARTGAGVGVLFEGGQMPLIRRLPKRGFSNKPFATSYEIVNLVQLESAFKDNEAVTPETLHAHGLIDCTRSRVKVLGNGELRKKLQIKAHAFSSHARDVIEKCGGEAVVIEER